MPIYMTGYANDETDRIKADSACLCPLGLLVQPLTRAYLARAGRYDWVGIDNGCFTEVGRRRFDPDAYLDMIREADAACWDNLAFATAPDVVCDWAATLRLSRPMLRRIRDLGTHARAAIVLQNGATSATVPWDDVEAVFVGGDDAWKEGPQAAALCREARRRGCWVHMGRVNGLRRMRRAAAMACDSVDGTYLLHEARKGRPVAGAEDILGWLRFLHRERRRTQKAALMRIAGGDAAWVAAFLKGQPVEGC